ncbi:hypothetical protein ABB37_05359 [Leptomonas pyrrhocoris]|uniref:Uncharacterized protein n=1 Tax=Leptomonas pyrrhocoris TaxID=157538 RepID=A0A0N0DUY0_LEPPY|nr:hypothetical protein ABB37_05359 [Leptomonas pyrrhocoris]KPA79541.1 hypothetical protein ABB37_05359 [Leptomonas pyrrhocoris]|eukprot:XP_015657980.1 hypothetical protein ABB37_05359 [Leptomonas pyrrhocoris]
MASSDKSEALAEELRQQLSGLQNHNAQLQHSIASLRADDAAQDVSRANPHKLQSAEDTSESGAPKHKATKQTLTHREEYDSVDSPPAAPSSEPAHEEHPRVDEPLPLQPESQQLNAQPADENHQRDEQGKRPTSPLPHEAAPRDTPTPLTAREFSQPRKHRRSQHQPQELPTPLPATETHQAVEQQQQHQHQPSDIPEPLTAREFSQPRKHRRSQHQPQELPTPLPATETHQAVEQQQQHQHQPSDIPEPLTAREFSQPRKHRRSQHQPQELPTPLPATETHQAVEQQQQHQHQPSDIPEPLTAREFSQPRKHRHSQHQPQDLPTPHTARVIEQLGRHPVVRANPHAPVKRFVADEPREAVEELSAHEAEEPVEHPAEDDHQWDELDEQPVEHPVEEEPREAVEELSAHEAEEPVEHPAEDDHQWDELDEQPVEHPVEEEPREAVEELSAHEAEEPVEHIEEPVEHLVEEDEATAMQASRADDYPTDASADAKVEERKPSADEVRVSRHSSQQQIGSMQNVPPLHDSDDEEDRSPDLWVKRKSDAVPQRRLSAFGRNPVITATDFYGVPLPGSFGGARIRNVVDRHRGLISHKTRPHTAEAGYVSLYADKFGGLGDGRSFVASSMPPVRNSDVDGQLADFVASSLLPASYRVTGQLQPALNRERGVAFTAAKAVVPASTVTAVDAANDETAASARFELTSAENGDVVEHDALAGLGYWNAENPKTTHYTKPSALLEAKEQRECTLFRRYSRNYEKLVTDTARGAGGEAGLSIQNSYLSFRAACDAEERKPVHQRRFYTGKAVDWRQTLLEQQEEMNSIARRKL